MADGKIRNNIYKIVDFEDDSRGQKRKKWLDHFLSWGLSYGLQKDLSR